MPGKADTSRKQAMAFIATYDRPDAGTYERRIVGIARTWLSIMKAKHPVQAVVDRLVDELEHPPPDAGCGWEELRTKFSAWAVGEERIK